MVMAQNTVMADLDFIYSLFDSAIDYQTGRNFPAWKGYDKDALIREVINGNQYKILIGGALAIVFSVCYDDKIIWQEKEKGDALYIHRIIVNPEFRGRKLFGEVLHWAINHARSKGLHLIRMDTWADNPALADYYKGFGFEIVGKCITPDSSELPRQNRNLALTLLEKDLRKQI
jgi:ribosomal protein S18 acetylase RimI-like enzyme